MTAGDRPAYRDLPDGRAWAVLDPALGSLALLTPKRVAAAAALVQSGRRFPLDLPMTLPDPPMFGREPMRHEVFHLFDHVLDDKLDNFFPQASTQWDGFGHYGHTTDGFFMGRTAEAVQADAPGVEAWAAVGIAGRGVLLDAARHTEIDPESSFVITPDLLDEIAAAQGTVLETGDILCVRTGWIDWYRALPAAGREQLAEATRTFTELKIPGVGPGAALAEWCWDHGIAALATDTPLVEPAPPSAGFDGAFGPNDMVHTKVMTELGIPLGEFFDLDALAVDCADDGRYAFLFTSKPLGIPGGIGSPPNAMAIK